MTEQMDQIVKLAPSELLSDEGSAGLFAALEADRDLAWDRSNLTLELLDHPRRALKWAMLAAASERYVADLQVELKRLRATLDARSRQALADGGVKATESMVVACVDSDPAWQQAQREFHAASATARLCADMRELFRHRKDLLVQEVLQQRSECGQGAPVSAFESRTRMDQLERRTPMTLAEAAAVGSPDVRPERMPVR